MRYLSFEQLPTSRSTILYNNSSITTMFFSISRSFIVFMTSAILAAAMPWDTPTTTVAAVSPTQSLPFIAHLPTDIPPSRRPQRHPPLQAAAAAAASSVATPPIPYAYFFCCSEISHGLQKPFLSPAPLPVRPSLVCLVSASTALMFPSALTALPSPLRRSDRAVVVVPFAAKTMTSYVNFLSVLCYFDSDL